MKTLRSVLMGAAVGAAVLVFEIVCATVAGGFPIVPDWRWILLYVGLATSTSVVVEVIGRRISWMRHPTDRASWTALALVAVALVLRAMRLPELILEAESIRAAVGGGVLVSYLAFARLLRVIARPPALGPALAAGAGVIALVSLMEFFHSSLSQGALALLSGIAAASVLERIH